MKAEECSWIRRMTWVSLSSDVCVQGKAKFLPPRILAAFTFGIVRKNQDQRSGVGRHCRKFTRSKKTHWHSWNEQLLFVLKLFLSCCKFCTNNQDFITCGKRTLRDFHLNVVYWRFLGHIRFDCTFKMLNSTCAKGLWYFVGVFHLQRCRTQK